MRLPPKVRLPTRSHDPKFTVPLAVRFWQLRVPDTEGLTAGRAPMPSGVATARMFGWTPWAGREVPV